MKTVSRHTVFQSLRSPSTAPLRLPLSTPGQLSPAQCPTSFESSDSVRSGQPLRHAQYGHLRRAARCWSRAAACPASPWPTKPTARSTRARQRRADLPRPLGRFPRRPPRRRGRRPAGGTWSSGRASRSTPIAISSSVPTSSAAAAAPRAPTASIPAPAGPTAAISRHHRRRHGPGAAAAGRALGDRAAAGGGGRLAGRPHGAHLGHALSRPRWPAPWPSPPRRG